MVALIILKAWEKEAKYTDDLQKACICWRIFITTQKSKAKQIGAWFGYKQHTEFHWEVSSDYSTNIALKSDKSHVLLLCA